MANTPDTIHVRVIPHMVISAGPDDIDGNDLRRLLEEHHHAADKHGYTHLLTNPALPEIDKLAALVEEIGEVSQLLTYDKRPSIPEANTELTRAWREHLAKELLQVANLALAWHHSVVNGGL